MEPISHWLFLFILPIVLCLGPSLAIHTTGGLFRFTQPQNPVSYHNANANANANIATTTTTPTSNVGLTLIEKACQGSLYKDFCITTLNSKPEAQAANLRGLAFLSMKLAKENGNVTATLIASKLKDENDLAPELDDALEDCNDQYDDALAQIEDSMQAFLAGAANDVRTWLSTAVTNAETCEQSMKDSGVDGGAIGDRNHVFGKLCSCALAVTAYYFQQQH